MSSRKRNPPANSEIIREQIQLAAAEKELKIALESIKDNINKLLVEELELKSALAVSRSSQSSVATPKIEPMSLSLSEQFDAVNKINEQKLDLFTVKSNQQSMEEYDDDD